MIVVTAFEAPAVAAGLDYIAVVNRAIEQHRGHCTATIVVKVMAGKGCGACVRNCLGQHEIATVQSSDCRSRRSAHAARITGSNRIAGAGPYDFHNQVLVDDHASRAGVSNDCTPPPTWYQTAIVVGDDRENPMAETHIAAAADTLDSANIVGKLKLRIIDHCLPLWSIEGWDQSTGGFVERLDIDGRADRAAPRRVRVQARQIYCFAKAAQLGWYPGRARDRAKGLGLSAGEGQISGRPPRFRAPAGARRRGA